jgi:hypothetical protein
MLHVVSWREAASSMHHVSVALLEPKPFRCGIADPQPNLDVTLVTVLLPQSIGHLFGDAGCFFAVLADDPGDRDPHFPIHRESVVSTHARQCHQLRSAATGDGSVSMGQRKKGRLARGHEGNLTSRHSASDLEERGIYGL